MQFKFIQEGRDDSVFISDFQDEEELLLKFNLKNQTSEDKKTRDFNEQFASLQDTLGFADHKISNSYILDKIGYRYFGIRKNGNENYIKISSINKVCSIQREKIRNILFGMCLFGVGSVSCELQSGETVSIVNPKTEISSPILSIHIEDELSIYEYESQSRLAGIIKSISDIPNVEFGIFLPDIEYYNYAVTLINKGYMNIDQFNMWKDLIQERVARIKRNIVSLLGRDIVLKRPLRDMESNLLGQINSKSQIDIKETIQILSMNPMFEATMHVFGRPQNFMDINYLGYIVGYIEALQEGDTIVVENSSESRIFVQASKLVSSMPQIFCDNNLVVIYPHEKLLYSQNSERIPLYFFNKPTSKLQEEDLYSISNLYLC